MTVLHQGTITVSARDYTHHLALHTPASRIYRKRIGGLDSHRFSFSQQAPCPSRYSFYFHETLSQGWGSDRLLGQTRTTLTDNLVGWVPETLVFHMIVRLRPMRWSSLGRWSIVFDRHPMQPLDHCAPQKRSSFVEPRPQPRMRNEFQAPALGGLFIHAR